MTRPRPVLREIPEKCEPYLMLPDYSPNLELAKRRRKYACKWFVSGYSLSELGLAMDISANRVSQILKKERVRDGR